MMLVSNAGMTLERATALAQWKVLLQDETALLAAPGVRHKVLLKQAHALHQEGVIDCDDLSDLLELADVALAYTIEALFDRQCAE